MCKREGGRDGEKVRVHVLLFRSLGGRQMTLSGLGSVGNDTKRWLRPVGLPLTTTTTRLDRRVVFAFEA